MSVLGLTHIHSKDYSLVPLLIDSIVSFVSEPEEILAEDVGKEKCRRYMTTGECQFGDNCRYSHITPDIHHQLTYRGVYKQFGPRTDVR